MAADDLTKELRGSVPGRFAQKMGLTGVDQRKNISYMSLEHCCCAGVVVTTVTVTVTVNVTVNVDVTTT